MEVNVRKILLGVFLFALMAAPGFAQDEAAAARAAAGCGPNDVNFDVKVNKKQHPAPAPEPGKALVYVFEQEKTDPGALKILAVTVRVGLDGSWVGANHGGSYFYFPVEPGEHSVCAAWQSTLSMFSKLGAAASLTAEPGQSYYFRISVDERDNRQKSVRLDPVDPAERQLLIGSCGLSTSHPKK
jgi:Protein of unknown function (DUF2846)